MLGLLTPDWLVDLQLVTFEAFRDLIYLMQCNYTESQGLEAAIRSNLEHRAQAVATAAAEAGLNKRQLLGEAQKNWTVWQVLILPADQMPSASIKECALAAQTAPAKWLTGKDAIPV